MPAIMTHDFFGQEAYARFQKVIGESEEQKNAFLLGNQGPDPLFYARANPLIASFGRFGSTMHATKTDELFVAFHDSLSTLTDDEKGIGRAYLLGFLCHYLLDSSVHPLVYANEYALCDAGVEGLSRKQGSEVHAIIESEYDEVMLYKRTGKTIADYAPQREILKASDETLLIIGKMYSYMAVMAYRVAMPSQVFKDSVKAFRFVQSVFHSPTGTKRAVLGAVEELVRPYSFYRSMSHRAIEASACDYDNHQHDAWTNPYTHAVSTQSLDDLFAAAQERIGAAFDCIDDEDFDADDAHTITAGMNFSGNAGAAE